MGHPFANVAAASLETLNALQAQSAADASPYKVDLMVGAFQTEDGTPDVFDSVKLARENIARDPSWEHQYPLSHLGEKAFRDASNSLLFGDDAAVVQNKCVASMQALGASGACHMGAAFLARHYPASSPGAQRTIYMPKETWVNHPNVFRYVGFKTATLPYFDYETKAVDLLGLFKAIDALPPRSIIVLQVCGNNPTGCDMSDADWEALAEIFLLHSHFAFLDAAYMGMASGDVGRDCFPIRHFASRKIPMLVAATWGKAFGLYGERVGHLCITTTNTAMTENIESQMKLLARAETGAQPRFGARILAEIVNDFGLRKRWDLDVKLRANLLSLRRDRLYDALRYLNTPGDWSFMFKQVGMFLYTSFTVNQVNYLREKHHVYLQDTGRLSIGGLQKSKVEYVAGSIDDLIRNGPKS